MPESDTPKSTPDTYSLDRLVEIRLKQAIAAIPERLPALLRTQNPEGHNMEFLADYFGIRKSEGLGKILNSYAKWAPTDVPGNYKLVEILPLEKNKKPGRKQPSKKDLEKNAEPKESEASADDFLLPNLTLEQSRIYLFLCDHNPCGEELERKALKFPQGLTNHKKMTSIFRLNYFGYLKFSRGSNIAQFYTIMLTGPEARLYGRFRANPTISILTEDYNSDKDNLKTAIDGLVNKGYVQEFEDDSQNSPLRTFKRTK